jgi:tetratricopeptide (TPR) repeat protein
MYFRSKGIYVLERSLHGANITASLGAVATAADLTFCGGAATSLGAALSAVSIYKSMNKSEQNIAKTMAQALQAHLDASGLSKDRKNILAQMLDQFPVSDDELAQGDYVAETVAANHRASVWDAQSETGKAKDPAHQTPQILDAYQAALLATLAPILSDPAFAPHRQMLLRIRDLERKLEGTSGYMRMLEAGINEKAITGLARRVAEDESIADLGAAWNELERAVEIAIDVQTENGHASNIDGFVDDVIERMAALSAEGRDDEASEAADRAFADWQERQEHEKLAADKLLDQALRTDLLRRDAKKAAMRLFDKAQIAFPDPAERFGRLHVIQDEWYVRGRDQALLLDLQVSAELAALVVQASANPEDMATALNDQAIVLRNLGEGVGGEQGLTWFRQAVDACDAALEIRTRDTMPADWAMTQVNRANTVRNLGERAGGEKGIIWLKEAVAAYDAALVIVTRDTMPADWAMTQMNRANTLRNLGDRAGGEQGMTLLKQAVDAYDAALEIFTRDAMPSQWAMTQTNRAGALLRLGERAGGERGMAWLRQALDACDAALQIRTRDTTPANWAITQMNRANVLMTLGERAGGEQGMAWLKQAIDAYDAALEIRTRDTMPADWAITQMNRATALLHLGERAGGEQGMTWLKEAVDAYDAALEIRTRDSVPADWAMTQMNRANTLAALGRLTGGERGMTWLKKAIDAYDAALEIRTRDAMPADWAMTQMNRANALQTLGKRAGGEQGMTWLEEAIDAYDAALETVDHPGLEHYAEVARRGRANAVAALERLKGGS